MRSPPPPAEGKEYERPRQMVVRLSLSGSLCLSADGKLVERWMLGVGMLLCDITRGCFYINKPPLKMGTTQGDFSYSILRCLGGGGGGGGRISVGGVQDLSHGAVNWVNTSLPSHPHTSFPWPASPFPSPLPFLPFLLLLSVALLFPILSVLRVHKSALFGTPLPPSSHPRFNCQVDIHFCTTTFSQITGTQRPNSWT